jgi:hypothetical protein
MEINLRRLRLLGERLRSWLKPDQGLPVFGYEVLGAPPTPLSDALKTKFKPAVPHELSEDEKKVRARWPKTVIWSDYFDHTVFNGEYNGQALVLAKNCHTSSSAWKAATEHPSVQEQPTR